MSETIFGYAWEDIQAMQQGTYTRPTLGKMTGPKPPTDADQALLVKYGEQGLRDKQLYGTMERLGIKP
jgi:hypothetical protein